MQVDTAKCQLSDQIDDATQRLLDAARIISEPDLGRPSLLPGWTRAMSWRTWPAAPTPCATC